MDLLGDIVGVERAVLGKVGELVWSCTHESSNLAICSLKWPVEGRG